MFRFVEFEAVHWDYWQRCRVPLEAGIVTIVGANGSGKTTFLDGLRTLLGLRCSKRRDEKHYLRHNKQPYGWLRAVVDNRRAAQRPAPFFPILDAQVTLACRIERKGGEWQRRFAVAAGVLDIETLQTSLTQDDQRVQWLGVRDYQARLARAGLTRAISEVLALEQGETDKLCEKSSKALLELVFQVFDDRATLDRYDVARKEQFEARQVLNALDVALEKLKAGAEGARTRVQRFHDYVRRAREREALVGEWQPRVAMHEALRQLDSARTQRRAQRRTLVRLREAALQAEQALGRAHAELEVANEVAETARVEREHALERQIKLRAQEEQVEIRLAERERLRKAARGAASSNVETVAMALQQERSALARLKFEEQRAGEKLDELRNERDALQGGVRADPTDMRQAREALQAAGIPHHAVEDAVEIRDTTWQAAVEAVLASHRHVIVLKNARQRHEAWAIGERLRLRHFITVADPAPTPTPGTVLEATNLRLPVPGWIGLLLTRTRLVENTTAGAQLDDTQDWVTRSGYLRERRGGRHAAPAVPVFGRARLEAVRDNLSRVEAAFKQAAVATQHCEQRIAELNSQLAAPDADRVLLQRAEQYALDEAQLPELTTQRRSAGEAYTAAENHDKATQQRSREADRAHALAHKHFDDSKAQLTTAQSQADNADEQQRCVAELRTQRAQWRQRGLAGWLVRHANAELATKHGDSRVLAQTLKRLEEDLEGRAADNDASVEAVLERLEADIAARQTELERRLEAHADAVAATDAARAAYIGVLRDSARRYVRNVHKLADLATVTVEHTLPQIDNSEESLARAGLDLRFGFDGKEAGALHEGEASGGQQVIQSLILLLALMMEDDRPGGFVFIDEPFAHLDIVNIGRVAQFLQATNAQYLITTPVTHNKGVFDPATLVLQTLKKRPGEPWAPTIQRLHKAAS